MHVSGSIHSGPDLGDVEAHRRMMQKCTSSTASRAIDKDVKIANGFLKHQGG